MTQVQVLTPGAVTPAALASGGFGSSLGSAIGPEYAGAVASQLVTGGAWQTNQCFAVQVDIPWPRTITGVGYFVGSAADAGVKFYSGLLDGAMAGILAQSAQVAQPGTSRQHLIPFTAPYAAKAGTYFMALATSSSTGTYWAAAACLSPWVSTASFGVIATQAMPAGWTVPGTNVPLCWLY